MKISVVIPAYNVAHFLPRCLESVFAQTLAPVEVIVIDDGSKDDSAEVGRKLGARVISRPNGGLSAARNTGVQNATSEWVALLDADDMWSPNKLEMQAERVQNDTVLVYTGIRLFDDKGVRDIFVADAPEVTRERLRYCNPIAPSSVIARRDALLRDGGFREDIRACEDWDMWVRLKRLGNFGGVPDPVTEYYVSPSSMSANPKRMLDAMEQILPTTLLSDLDGPQRWIWARKVRSAQLFSAAMIARDNHLRGEVNYMLQSLAAWPSPFWQPNRFAALAVSVRNELSRPRSAQ